MQKLYFVLGTVIFLILALTYAPAAQAVVDATCTATPASIGPAQSTTINCTGFDPNTQVYAYYVEPDGTAVGFGGAKSNASGSVSYTFNNGVLPYFTLQLGNYSFVVEELGPGGAKVHTGLATFTISGGTGPAPNVLTSVSTTVTKPGSITVTGSGFAPYEVATAWLNLPNPCSSFTSHFTDGNNGATFENIPNYAGEGTAFVGNAKANGAGAVTATVGFSAESCSGAYELVVRGNTSGVTEALQFTLTGSPVATNAFLVPSRPSVNAFNDTITFAASGFGANESLNCWLTTPDGRAIPYGISGSLQAGPVMGPGGTGTISLTTGSLIFSPDDPFLPPGAPRVRPLMSEGPLGQWAMTCHGLSSGAYAIAWFTVTGSLLDP